MNFSACDISENLYTNDVKIIAHRGYHTTYLENTLESFDAAYSRNFKYIELDINFTKDHQPVVLHDPPMEDQSNVTGYINEYYLSDIPKIKLAGKYSIPILEDVFKTYKYKFDVIFIDIKGAPIDSNLIVFTNLIKKYDMYKKTIITAGNSDNVLVLKKLDSNLELGYDGGFEDGIEFCMKNKFKYQLVAFTELDRNLCKLAKLNNIKVYAYTPNLHSQLIETLKYDIDGIMTDNPDMAKRL